MPRRAQQHKNIPLFIPHMGCPYRCVFCDQCAISGHGAFDISTVREELERALATLPQGSVAEIAFFGGSFTAIDRPLMIALLDMAQQHVDAGRVSGIRFSTRPDAVEDDVLDALSPYKINAIELGLQSMDDDVLCQCQRGHSAARARAACRRVVARGYSLVGQMMLGLPASDEQKEEATAREICALGAQGVRVYPTVVFDRTPLADRVRRGEYTPLTNEQAAARAASVLRIFEEQGVQVLRVGLCASDVLASSRVLGGANHPSLGELAYSALFLERMSEVLAQRKSVAGQSVTLAVPQGKVSQAIGQHRANVLALCRRFGLTDVRVRQHDGLHGTQVRLIE